MKEGLVGRKIGMLTIFKESEAIPVTAIQAGPCTVLSVEEKKRKRVMKLGLREKGKPRLPLPQRAYYEKHKLPMVKVVKEFETSQDLKRGDVLGVDLFSEGEKVSVRGRTIGRGFQGVMRRHGYKGGPASHGSMVHRKLQSVGDTNPNKVHKGKGMPGRMGGGWVCCKNVEVVETRKAENILFVRGSVPGKRGGLLYICKK